YYCELGSSVTVTYDHRALVIDGKRRILQSGSFHYPRTTPEMWPEIIRKSKEGGLDVIETYYYFEGRFDLVKFVRTVHEAGLYVHLRIGPYVCAEWNYGGFPLLLHFIPGVQFRTTNENFEKEMNIFLVKIVNLMKEENLFASQGGPIILAQVENEYGNVEGSYGVGRELYIRWAAETAISLNTTVLWVMCTQSDAPDPIINTCNGCYCDGFTPNSPSKPKMWTENYSGWFLSFGYAVPHRPVEDLAFSVARFLEKGGTFQNYYMYFGGTNFGRTVGGPLIATSYDYDAPIDEYGFTRQPKWGHLRDLHKSIKHCEDYLVNADPTQQSLGTNLECFLATIEKAIAAQNFLANYDSSVDASVSFNGNSYFLPAWSVSILPDCKNVIFNTAKVDVHKFYVENLFCCPMSVEVVSQRTAGDVALARSTSMSEFVIGWSWYKEEVGVWSNNSFVASSLLEQINTTKDISDFLWYTTSINVDENMKHGRESEGILLIESLGHAALVFVNKKLVGFSYGNHDIPNFLFSEKISLNYGNNTLDVLSMMIGLQNYGPWFDIAGAGIFSVILGDLKNGKKNLSSSEWTYQVGLKGEYLGLDKMSLANSSVWIQGSALPTNQSLMWYKATFLAPKGSGPLMLNLASMGKGQACVNGQGIGRCWPAYISPSTGCVDTCDYRGTYEPFKCLKKCGQPAQTLYHIPRSWVHPGQNLLVLHEELGGDPSKVSVLTQTGKEVCAHVSEDDPPQADSWKSYPDVKSQGPKVRLAPEGDCGAFSPGSCRANVLSIVQRACLGKQGCSVPLSMADLGDPCPGMLKSLAVEALCSA
ncbi:hypothetical protein RJ640_001804, partial [Escallonia rubra]